MFKSYIKIAIRNLFKNKLYSFINIFGLGIAIAICITGYINYDYSQSFDSFHRNKDNIYLVNTYRVLNGREYFKASSPTPLSSAMYDNIPGIEKFTRIARNGGSLRYGDKVFNESIHYLDEDFFDMFTFPVIWGDQNGLKDQNGIVITQEISQKYFGDENPVGKQIIFNPDRQHEYSFFIRSVIENPSTRSSIKLSVCIPYKRQIDILGYDIENWNDWTSAAFIEINPESSLESIRQQANTFIPRINEANPRYPLENIYFTNLPELSGTTRKLSDLPFKGGFTPAQIVAPSVIAILVLILACVNFVNTAIAYAATRFKEIGIRKVIGGVRSQLVKQFLGENLMLCGFALFVGIVLAEPFVNVYGSLFPEENFILNYFANPDLILFLIGVLLFTAITAGAYPAFYISKFNPVNIFRGKSKIGGTNNLIRVLLILQFSIALTSILSGFILYNNGEYVENFDLGFDTEQVMIVPVANKDAHDLFRNSIQNHPDIISVGGSQHNMGYSWSARDVKYEDANFPADVFNIGDNFFETTGMKLLNGIHLDFALNENVDNSVLINEAMVNKFDWKDPIGKFLIIENPQGDKEHRITGVVKDIHLNGLWLPVRPIIIKKALPENYRCTAIKFNISNIREVSSFVQSTWKEIFPNFAYEGFFQSAITEETMQITQSIKLLFIYIAIITLMLSGLGLFALVSLNIARKTKEIGIRRVLGANYFDVSYFITREFIILLFISGIVGSVLGYFMINALLSNIWAYHTGFGLIPFLLSISILIILALLTVSTKIYMVITDNPADSLRYE